jgi:hypothetical protein
MNTRVRRYIGLTSSVAVCVALSVASAELNVETGTGTTGASGTIAVPAPGSGGSGAPIAGQEDVLLFMNKDQLHGNLMAVMPDKFGLRWQHPEVKKPIEMSLDGISKVKLASRSSQKKRAHAATVRLTNDDESEYRCRFGVV